ncbi:MAG: polyphosphate polymerase domain-containing protein [Clostridia bacterium]|nr:polyphosphate polymerase domain-containing protein [Clostridia bacterium]
MKCDLTKGSDGVAFKTNFRRREIKFLITEAEAKEILLFMSDKIVPDAYGKSTVKSLYFDTPSFRLIRRSLEKPIYKEKFRLRCYGDFNDKTKVFAEIKKKYKSVVYKRRIVLNEAEMLSFLENGPPDGNDPTEKEISFFFKRYENLKPAMLISCEREAYFAKNDDGLRFTFDRNIVYRDHDLSLQSERYGTPVMNEGQVLMEVKAEGALPLWVCRMLSERKMYKQSFSKYGRAYIDTLLKAKIAVQTAKGE